MEFLIGILIWVAWLGAMLVLSGWVLGPLEQRGKRGQRRLQFTLGDWICLALMIQLWAAMVHSFVAIDGGGGALIMDIYGWGLGVILWFGVVQRLSAAGIRKTWYRGVALVVIYPLNVLGAIIAPSLLVTIVYSLPGAAVQPVVPVASAVALALLLAAMMGSAYFVRKIVAALDLETVEKGGAGRSFFSGQRSQGHKTADPEHGQDDCKEK